MAAAFLVFNNSSDKAAAPFADGPADFPAVEVSDPPGGFGTPTPPYPSAASEFPDTVGTPDGSGKTYPIPHVVDYITVQMDASDIFRGKLVLINSDHHYDIPESRGYIYIDSERTSSYRVADIDMTLTSTIIRPLNNMMDAFYAETGLNPVAITRAFRTYAKQQAAFNQYVATVGRDEAEKWASLPGYSEHHSGLAIDLGIFDGTSIGAFSDTGQYAWFKENSYKFGFILRYPPEKSTITKISHVPWHFRYVRNPHAYIIFENGWCLEEYIDFITEHRPGDGYWTDYDGDIYEIYYTRDTEIDIPAGFEYTTSGNNSDGFIVTIKWPMSE
jgi:D-alanyl-D-alanine carboxypeptidase